MASQLESLQYLEVIIESISLSIFFAISTPSVCTPLCLSLSLCLSGRNYKLKPAQDAAVI